MSYILTAVYTSSAGDAAARYAAELALALKVPLHLIHPYVVPISIGEIPMPLLPVEEVRQAATVRMTNIVAQFSRDYPMLPLKAEVAYGNPADIFEDREQKPLLAVIGNDESDDSDVWMGSESAEIMRESSFPVLAVPRTLAFRPLRHLCLACDTRALQEGLPVDSLLQLQDRLGFKITILHVAGAGDGATYEGSSLERQLDGKATGYSEVSVSGAVDEAIASFADTNGIDWLAVAPHHYGFWEGLFHKSHTSRVLHLAHVPVLGLH